MARSRVGGAAPPSPLTTSATSSRGARRSTQTAPVSAPAPTRGRYRGEAGRRQANAERERIAAERERRKNAPRQPYRFWMPQDTQRDILVLDEQPDFYRYEHALLNNETGKNDLYTDCIEEKEICPVCVNTESRKYYGLYMSVIDLTPYTPKKPGSVEVPWSRKLFVVKSGMQRAWAREYERNGSLRGKVFTIYRDTDKDPVSGNQIEPATELDGDVERDVEPYTEEEMAAFVREWTDRDGKQHTEDCSIPFDYDAIMPQQSFDELAALVGAGSTPGSRRYENEQFGDSAGEAADTGGVWEEPVEIPVQDPARVRKGARERGESVRKTTQVADADTSEEAPVARGTRVRGARRTQASIDDEDLPF